MIDPDTEEIPASDIRPGDLVDLESCPFLSDDPSAEFELATVVEVDRTVTDLIDIGYDGLGSVGYQPDQLLRVRRRELFPPGYFDQF